MNDKAVNQADRSSQVVANQEPLPRIAKNESASIINFHAQTEVVFSSAHDNQTSTKPSFPLQETPLSSLLPYNLQPEQYRQDNVAMDVDNNLDYNTNTDLSAPFFEKPYPTSLLSSLDATSDSEKEQQQADLKRRREEDDDLDGNNIQNKQKPRNQTSSNLQNIGIGRSTKASHILNEKVANGSFVLNPKRWMNFRKKVILLDCDAILKDNEPKSVRHSKCGKCIQMKEPYNIAYFESHVAKCKNRTTSNTLTIENMFKNHPQPKQKKMTESQLLASLVPA